MNLKKAWADPVWSKVIAAIIIAVGSIIITVISSRINNATFQSYLIKFTTIQFPLWLLIVLIIVFLIFFKIKIRAKKNFVYDNETLQLDKQLFEKIREILPQKGSISKIRYFHSSLGFRIDDIEDLESFEDHNIDPDFEFLNPELEKVKTELFQKVSVFTMKAYFRTRQIGEKREVHPRKDQDSEKHQTNMNEIDNSAREVSLKYDELIKLCRRTLKI